MFNSTRDSQPSPTLKVVVGCGYVGQRAAMRWRNQGDTVLAITRSTERAAELAALGLLPIVWDWKSQIDPAPIILDTLGKNKIPRSMLSPSEATPSEANRDSNSLLIAVSHAVPEGQPPEEQHVQGLDNLQRAMNQINFACRWIYLSTTGVFADGIPGALCDESSPVAPARPGSRGMYVFLADFDELRKFWVVSIHAVDTFDDHQHSPMPLALLFENRIKGFEVVVWEWSPATSR